MALAYSSTVRNAMLQTVVDNTSSGFVRIYDGARPASGGSATTLLAELALAGASGSITAAGVLTFAAISADTSADNSGTATWFRVVSGNSLAFVIDGSVSTSGSDLNLNTQAIVASARVEITSFVITEGNP